MVGLAGLSIPSFWLGIMMILVFSVSLGWLPSGGYVSLVDDWAANLRSLLMPSIVLGTASLAVMMRHTRSAMLTVLKQDFIRTARSKGLSEKIVVLRHAIAKRAYPGGHPRNPAAWTASLRRRPDGASVWNSGIWQDDCRWRFQPRLRGGPSRRDVRRGVLSADEPIGRSDIRASKPSPPHMSIHDDSPSPPPPSIRSRSVMARLLREPAALIGALIVVFFLTLAALAPVFAPYDPNASDWMAIREAPSWSHPFGTDDLGRDMLSRVIYGARASLAAGFISVSIAMAIGVPLGLIAGYFGGITDMVISRCADALLACPFLVLAIALAAFLGASLENAMIAIGISAMPIFIRVTRGQALSVRAEDYVSAAVSQGVSHTKILTAYIFPNVLPPVIVQATLTVAIAVLAEASLAFLGLGQPPPAPSWGSMLDAARQFLVEAPWMAIWPGIAIVVVVIGFNMLGDALNDVLNPRA